MRWSQTALVPGGTRTSSTYHWHRGSCCPGCRFLIWWCCLSCSLALGKPWLCQDRALGSCFHSCRWCLLLCYPYSSLTWGIEYHEGSVSYSKYIYRSAWKLYYNDTDLLKRKRTVIKVSDKYKEIHLLRFKVSFSAIIYCSPESCYFAATEIGANAAPLKQGVNLARKDLCEYGKLKMLSDFSGKMVWVWLT